jgi:hypothetical protein
VIKHEDIKDDDIVVTIGCAAVHPDRVGGQHVAKPCSGVRLTHVPTNTSVMVDTERSQHANRARAMDLLRERIVCETEVVDVNVPGCLACNSDQVTLYMTARGVDVARLEQVPRPTKAWIDILPCEVCGVCWLVRPPRETTTPSDDRGESR